MTIQVPRYSGPQVASKPISAPRGDARAAGSGNAAIAQLAEQAGNAFQKIQQQERDRADQAALLEADNTLDGWETSNVLDAENGALTRRGRDAFDLPNQYLSSYDKHAKAVEDGLGSERARTAFRAQAQRRRSQISRTLEQHEFSERQSYYDEQDAAKLASSQQMAGNYYNNPERIRDELDKQDAVVAERGKRKGLSAELISEEKRQNHSNVHADVVTRYIARGEYKKGRVYFDEVKDQIGADAATRIEAAFTAERERVKTEVKQSMNDQLRDISAAAGMGLPVTVPTESTLKAIYGEHEGGQRFKIAHQAQELSPKIAEMRRLPASELDTFVASQRPKNQEGAADQAVVANFLDQKRDQILQEREADPAGYIVSSSSPARTAWQAFTSATNEAQRDALAETYMRILRAERERLQIKKQDLLPNGYANALADRINAPESAEGLATSIEREANRWGSSWSKVYAQIAPKISDTAAVIGSGVPRSAAVALSTVASLKQEELKALLPPGVTWGDLEKDVDSQMEDFKKSLPASGIRTLNAFRESTTRLAARYLQEGGSTGEAAKRAYRDLVGGQYSMVEFRGVPMRVPATIDRPTASTGARVLLENYEAKSSAVIVPADSPLTPEEYASDLTAYVREHGYLVTNPDGTGVRLYVDGGPVPGGRTGAIDVGWSELAALGAAERERLDQRFAESKLDQ